MAQPTPQDVHIDAALSDSLVAYIQDATNFIASTVFPPKPVDHKTDKYFTLDKNDWNRDDAVLKRAPGAKAPRSGFTLSNNSYDRDAWWTEVPLSDMVLKNSDPSLRIDEAGTRLVTQRMLIRRERLFATNYFQTGVWATDVVGGVGFTQWDDYSSDPQKDIDLGRETILQNAGMMPDCLTVGFKVHNALKRHPLIKDTYKYTSSESITEEMIANVFELKKYVVAKASYNSANEGAVAVFNMIQGNNALLTYSEGGPSIMEPCAGVIFEWTGLTAVNSAGVAIDQYYDVTTKDDVVRGQFAFDMAVTGNDLGYFFSNAISAGA